MEIPCGELVMSPGIAALLLSLLVVFAGFVTTK